MFDGFCIVENCVQLPPTVLLYSHFHEVGSTPPVEVSVNCTINGEDPDKGVPLNPTTGADKSNVWEVGGLLTPLVSFTVSVTVYTFGKAYVWVGLFNVEVFPSPKSQAHCTGEPVD